jgi:hypothetical protein
VNEEQVRARRRTRGYQARLAALGLLLATALGAPLLPFPGAFLHGLWLVLAACALALLAFEAVVLASLLRTRRKAAAARPLSRPAPALDFDRPRVGGGRA